MLIVNEAGLYNLIFKSQKLEAKAFKRWITHEVIPSIRKTGSYSIPNKKQQLFDLQMEREHRLMTREKRLTAQLLKEMAEDFVTVLSPTSIQQLTAEASKILCGIDVIDKPALRTKFYQAGEIGKEFGISANMVGRIANKNKLKTEEFGIWILDKSKNSTKQIQSFMYNEVGKSKILDAIEKNKN